MNWRDFFYFSKGERRALIVLTCLIAAAWITLLLTDKTTGHSEPQNITQVPAPPEIPSPTSSDSTPPSSPIQKVKALIVKENPGIPKKATKRKSTYIQTEKYPAGTIIELNTADTTILKKIPGIGTTFSNRIVKYRNLLGGFYSITQLGEVYGIDEDRYQALKEWFTVNPHFIQKRSLNTLSDDSLYRHPYINRLQARAILQQRKQKGKLSGWDNLTLLDEFANMDKDKLNFYFSFE